MKKTRTFHSLTTTFLSSALALFVFTQCTTEEPKVEASQATAEIQTVANEADTPLASLTIDGTHTAFISREECKKCDYVVPEDASVVDGKELGIKPGQAICLNEGFHYGNLKIINLEGTEKNPIVVAYGPKATAVPVN